MSARDPTAPPDPFSLCGTTIEGKYRVASVVGDGGFGVVYRGVHKGFGELIAIKCLKLPQELDEARREALLEQLRDEGRILHRLSKATSGIVQALDVGAFTTANGAWVPYLVLEWLEGETLGEHLANRLERGEKPYALADGIRLLEPAARALAIAHQQKVAHRDVKPPNLFVTDVGGVRTVKVLDFGIAKVITETTAQLEATKVGASAFTPRYGAPEQFNKQRGASGPWTDVFALALILVEVVTGKKALEGDDPTELYIASADTNRRPTLRVRGVEASDAVEKVLGKALAVDPKERYADAGTFWDALVDAAGMPTTRSSAPALPSAAPAAAIATPAAAASATRDLAAPTPRDHPALGATMPVESLAGATPAVVVENKNATPRAAASSRPRLGDAMEETPIHARLPPASPTSRPTELTLIPKKAPPKKSKQHAMWPYVVMLLAIGGGAVYFTMRAGLDETSGAGRGFKPSFGGSATAAHGKPRPSHAATGTPSSEVALVAPGSASATGSASALPMTPPAEMVSLGPAGKVTHRFFLDKLEVSTRDYLECVKARQCSAADKVTGLFDEEKVDAPSKDADGGAAEPAPAPTTATQDYLTEWSSRCNAHGGPDNHPINCVDLREAQAFCTWKEKRLPSEAEWDLAARGVENRMFPWGASAPTECGDACYDKNGACLRRAAGGGVSTCVAGGRPADKTPEGVFDLGGNVSEWTADGVVRGGNFTDAADLLKGTTRHEVAPSLAHAKLGFRCATDAAPLDAKP